MAVTVAQVEEALRELANYPDWNSPNRHQRLRAIYRATAYYVKEAQDSPHPLGVAEFPIDIYPGQTEIFVPYENFGGIESVTSNPDYYPGERVREIAVLNRPNAEKLRYTVTGSSERVRAVSWREEHDESSGESRRYIETYPYGATDHLVVSYHVMPSKDALLVDGVPLADDVALTLVPAHAIRFFLIDQLVWPGRDTMAARGELRGKLDAILAVYERQYERDVFYPNKAHPSAKLQGSNARRRRLRRRGC
jgi:hypothetical protein